MPLAGPPAPLLGPSSGGGQQVSTAVTWKLCVPHPAQATACTTPLTSPRSLGASWVPAPAGGGGAAAMQEALEPGPHRRLSRYACAWGGGFGEKSAGGWRPGGVALL